MVGIRNGTVLFAHILCVRLVKIFSFRCGVIEIQYLSHFFMCQAFVTNGVRCNPINCGGDVGDVWNHFTAKSDYRWHFASINYNGSNPLSHMDFEVRGRERHTNRAREREKNGKTQEENKYLHICCDLFLFLFIMVFFSLSILRRCFSCINQQLNAKG